MKKSTAKKPIVKKNPVGAPRTTSFSKEEMIKLGKEMLDWVKINQPIHLCQWYTIHKGFLYREWKTFIQLPEFLPYYEQALKLVGMKYLDGTIDKSIAQRFLRLYFGDLKEEENETKEFESKLKTQENTMASEKDIERFDAVMNQLGSLQSIRKIEDKRISNEQ